MWRLSSLLDQLRHLNKITLPSIPVQWIPLLELYDPELPQFPAKYVHLVIDGARVFGFPVYLNYAEPKEGWIVPEIVFLSNVEIEKDGYQDAVATELSERFGIAQKIDLDTLKGCCNSNTGYANFVEDLWKRHVTGMYGDYIPYGRFYDEAYSLPRFTSALASPGGAKTERIMLYNFLTDFGEKVAISGQWSFLDFFLLPTYEEIRKRNFADFPRLKKLMLACDEFGRKFFRSTTKIGRFTLKHASSGLPQNDEGYRKLTSKNFQAEHKDTLDRLLDGFNRFPLRAFAMIATLCNIWVANDFKQWNRKEFHQAYAATGMAGFSKKATATFLQQGFGNPDAVPIDTWVTAFYKTSLNIADDIEFLNAFTEIGKFERLIWLSSQARKMNAQPFRDCLWCIKFGTPMANVTRGPNPLSCGECDLRSECPGYSSIKQERVALRHDLEEPNRNDHIGCRFAIGTENGKPKSVYRRKKYSWKLVDEFSGYVLHFNSKHVGKVVSVGEVADEVSKYVTV